MAKKDLPSKLSMS